MKIEKWNSKQGENIGGINSNCNISFIIDANKKHLHINNKAKGKSNDWIITIIEDNGNYKVNGQQIKNGMLTDLIFDFDYNNNNLTLSDKEQTYCNSSLDSLEETLKFISMF